MKEKLLLHCLIMLICICYDFVYVVGSFKLTEVATRHKTYCMFIFIICGHSVTGLLRIAAVYSYYHDRPPPVQDMLPVLDIRITTDTSGLLEIPGDSTSE